MNLLISVLLALQQAPTEEELRAIVDRFNAAIQAEDDEGRKLSYDEVRRAGPPIVKHLAAAFPGRHVKVRKECPSLGWENEREYPLAFVMVISFREQAMPHLISLTRDPDPAKARIAAALLRHYPVKEIVGPLIEYSKSRDLDSDPEVKWTVHDVLVKTTFLDFKSLKDLEAWFEKAKTRFQVEWLREAVDRPDLVHRDYAIRGMYQLMESRERLKVLLRCFLDLDWTEAGHALYGVTGHPREEGGKNLWDAATKAAAKLAWGEFRKLPEKEQLIECALHCAGSERESLPGRFMTPTEAGKFILDNPDAALDRLERIAVTHPQCEGAFTTALQFAVTAKNWDRAVALLPKPRPGYGFLFDLLQNSKHPSMADKMLDMVIAGQAETMDFRCLMTEFPKRVRPDMVPKILESIPKTAGRNRSTLLDALGRTADPRGWEVLEKEIFSDIPNSLMAATLLEYFSGDKVIAALRNLLTSKNYQGLPLVARLLADRGDNSGVPVLIAAVESAEKDLERVWFIGGLIMIRGGPNFPTWDRKTPVDYKPFLAEYKAWWEKNKDRSRVEWLLESLEAGVGIDSYFPNPLLLLGEESLKDVSPELAKPELRKEIVRRLREWVQKSGFTFNKDTPRVPYHKPAVAPR